MRLRRHKPIRKLQEKWRRPLTRWAIALLCAGFSAIWIGCSPAQKYQTLSFFFDGVPDPAAASKGAAARAGFNTGHAPLAHQHKPFVEGNCAACHGPDNKKVDLAHVKEACISCHPKVVDAYPVMHSPVVTGDCLWCHAPHESAAAGLLVSASNTLCTQCHNLRMLSPSPAEHLDSQRSCLECHRGHGGATAQCLKPAATTAPATSTHGGAS